LIFIGIGSNLHSDMYGAPLANCEAALAALGERGLSIIKRARWYESAPVPVSDQPWFVNGVVTVSTTLSPQALLDLLHDIEHSFGRVRRVRNEARILDLDFIAYDDLVIEGEEGAILPHPRMHQRAFVLLPMGELAPDWVHPVLKTPIEELVLALPRDQEIRAVM
jgi:2-amino-4-hydroxy-6-hydroxymethyldihydropteridine diphosphokinase